MKLLFSYFILIICLYGCHSVERDRQRFIETFDYEVGLPFSQFHQFKPVEKEYLNNGSVKYFFKDSSCVWWMLVDNGVTKDWGVVSNTDDCVIKTGFAP